MNAQHQPHMVTLNLSIDEANTILRIIAETPLPYNTSHHLITRIASQLQAPAGEPSQSATGHTQADDADGADDGPREHEA